MENNIDILENDLKIDSAIQTYLSEAIAWTKFLSIIGFIISGLTIVLCVSLMFAGSMGAGVGAAVTVFYLLLTAATFFLSNLLFRFTKTTKAAFQNNDQICLEFAFKNLSAYFRLAGIATIVAIGLSLCGGIAAVVFDSFGR